MRRCKVVIVGAGFGGLTMGAALRVAGNDDFVILEEGDDVGGVWRENTYPGSACDVPSHLYSFGFDPYRDAEVRFPRQDSILDYMRAVTDRNGLRHHVRSNTSVASANYVDADGTWTLTMTDGQLLHAGAVVWAVGQLHRPAVPDIPGTTAFTGRAFHSAQWDHGADLTGHVAVVGTGSSAAQMVPELARNATTVTVYQRTPSWIMPKPADRFGPVTRRALTHVPGLHRLYRAGLYRGADLVLAPVMRGGWSARPAQWLARAHLRRQVPDRTLRDKLTPNYRIGEKRILMDSRFYPALTLPHVELVTDPIDQVTSDGIRTVTGAHRRADVIVWATGFRAPEFLGGVTVQGQDGADLHAGWAERGRPEAFFGLAVPGFPSMYLIAGPHSFTPANSNPSMKEHQVRYIMKCLALSAQLGAPITVTPTAMAAYRRWLDAALARTVWPDGVPSWFKRDSDGPVTNPWPASARKFARLLKTHPRSTPSPRFPSRSAPPIDRPSPRPRPSGAAHRPCTCCGPHPVRPSRPCANRSRFRPRRPRTFHITGISSGPLELTRGSQGTRTVRLTNPTVSTSPSAVSKRFPVPPVDKTNRQATACPSDILTVGLERATSCGSTRGSAVPTAGADGDSCRHPVSAVAAEHRGVLRAASRQP